MAFNPENAILSSEFKKPSTGATTGFNPSRAILSSEYAKPEDGRGVGDVAADLWSSFAGGANALLKIGGDIYGLSTGDMDNWASNQGSRGQEYWSERKSDQLKGLESQRKAKVDATESDLGKAGVAFWETVSSPSLLTSFIFEQVPMLIPVGAIGRAGQAATFAAKKSGIAGAGKYSAQKKAYSDARELSGKAGSWSAVGAGGAMQGSDAGSSAYEQLISMPESVWMQNPEVSRRVNAGESFDEVKAETSLSLSRNAAIASGIASVGLNMIPGARVLEKSLVGVKLPKGRASNVVGGFAGESLQEGLEEGSGALFANLAGREIDTSIDPMEGVGEATGLGLTSGVFGGVAGATAPTEGVSEQDKVNIDKVLKADDIDSAINESSLAVEGYEGPLPTGPIVEETPVTDNFYKQPFQKLPVSPDEYQGGVDFVDPQRPELGLVPKGDAEVVDSGVEGIEYDAKSRLSLAPYESEPMEMPASEDIDAAYSQRQQDKDNEFDLALKQRADNELSQAIAETSENELLAKYSSDAAPESAAMSDALLGAYLRKQVGENGFQVAQEELEEARNSVAGPDALERLDSEIDLFSMSASPSTRLGGMIDTLSKFHGGINVDDAKAQGLMDKNQKSGFNWVFTKKGITLDEIGEALMQEGWFPNGRPDANEVLDMLADEMRGAYHYSTDGQEHQSLMQERERMLDHEAQQESEALYDESNYDDDITPSETYLQELGYYALVEGVSPEALSKLDDQYGDNSNFLVTAINKEIEDARASGRWAAPKKISVAQRRIAASSAQRQDEADIENQQILGEQESIRSEISPELYAEIFESGTDSDGFSLESQTEEPLQAEAERIASLNAPKQEVESSSNFLLTGSDSSIDKAEARGQDNLFDQKADSDKAITGYHATSKDFNEFDDSKIGTTYGNDEPGHYFYISKDDAIGSTETPSVERIVERSLPSNLYEVDASGVGDVVSWWDTQDKEMYADSAKDEGAEGIIVKGDKASFAVVFEASSLDKTLDEKAHEAATSPTNDLSEPTESQIEAENYKLGRVELHGIKIGIENPKGSTRSGTDPDGQAWQTTMNHHYGNFTGSKAADGDAVDVFIGDSHDSEKFFVIDQVNKDGSYDEAKVMAGFNSKEDAIDAYKSNYDEGWLVGPVTEITADQLKEGLKTDSFAKPLSGGFAESKDNSQAPSSEKGVDSSSTEAIPVSDMSQDEIVSEIDELTSKADKVRTAHAEMFPSSPVMESNALSVEDSARLHELKQSLPSHAEEAAAAKERIARRVAGRKESKSETQELKESIDALTAALKSQGKDKSPTVEPAKDDDTLFSQESAPGQVEVTQNGKIFKTGEPVTFSFIHNKESATALFGVPDKNSPYGRGYEPAGRFVTVTDNIQDDKEGFDVGEITFNNPLVVANDSLKWKKSLSDFYDGKTGKELSKAVIADGYDGIVTVDEYSGGSYVSETVDLTTFDEGKALYSQDGKTMYVAHNLSAENLIYADDLGGLAAPSLAIADIDTGAFDSFGEITLLAKPQIISSPKARTFDADVYTPRQPSALNKVSYKEYNKLIDSLDADTKKFRFLRNPDASEIESRGMDELIRSEAVQYQFLVERDVNIPSYKSDIDPIVKKAAKVSGNNSPGILIQFDKVRSAAEEFYAKEAAGKREILRDVYYNEDGSLDERFYKEFAYKIISFNRSSGLDEARIKGAIIKKVQSKKHKADFENHVSDILDDVVEKKVLFKGFTPSGNRKYAEYNMQNVVKEMTAALRGGENFNYGAGSLRAHFANEMKTLKAIKSRQSQLKTKEEVDAIKEESNDKLMQTLDYLKPHYKYDSNSFGYYGDASNAIAEGRRGLNDAFDMDQGDYDAVAELVSYLRSLPTEYFETKVQRAVGINEFETAIVPRGTNKKAVQILKDNGIKIKYYKAGDNESRMNAVRGTRNVLFSNLTASKDDKGTSVESVKSAISGVVDSLNSDTSVTVVKDINDPKLPSSIRGQMKRGVRYKGVYDSGHVYIIADNIVNARDARVALAHELIGHKGVLEGDDWNDVRSTIISLIDKNSASAVDIMKEVDSRYQDKDQETKYKEFVAVAAERRVKRGTIGQIVAKVKELLRRALKSMGFTKPFSDSELDIILSNSESYLRGSQAPVIDSGLSFASSDERTEYEQAVAKGLPMDIDSRMERAYEQGYDTETKMYHGTSDDIASFDLGKTQYRDSGFIGTGVYITSAPRVADFYANTATSLNKDSDGDYSEANVIQVITKAQNTKTYSLAEKGDFSVETGKNRSFSKELTEKLISEGYDSAQVVDASGAIIEMVVFDPANIRSVNAAFDPEFEGSSDLLASQQSENEALFSQESEFSEENRRLREEDKTIWSKAKKEIRRQLTPGGLLPESVFKGKIARDSNMEVVEFDVAHLVGELERAIRKDYGVTASKLSDSDLEYLADALTGKIPDSVKGKTKEILVAMRQYIDNQSSDYKDILMEQANDLTKDFDTGERALLSAFIESGGIFADSNTSAAKAKATKARAKIMDSAKEVAKKYWGSGKPMQEALSSVSAAAEKISLMKIIAGNEGEYIHRSYQAFDDKDWYKKVTESTLDNARRHLMSRYIEQGMSRDEAVSRSQVVMDDILKEGTAYGGFESFIKESKLGAKDLSVLKKRKQIAPEIRALLGEYKDPRLNFSKTATKMGRLIWNQRFLEHIKKIGMGEFLFTEDNRPPGTTKIAAEGSEVYAPLNGLYTYRETDQAFKDALGKEQMAEWYKTIVRMNGMVKFGKTILSPTTAMRNWQSAMFFTLANGHFDLSQMSKSFSGLKEYFAHTGSGEKLAYLRKLKELGVIYDTPYAGEMMRLLDDSQIENMFTGSKASMAASKMLGAAQKAYAYGDDFWKIIGFENEKNMLIKHAGMSQKDAEIEAAERIRNTYPTYSMVGRGVQSLRRFPLAGTFVSFPAEIIRTSINMMKYLAKDMKNPKTRPMAMRRAAGLAIASGFAYALQELSKSMFDIDDDDEEAVRLQAAPWQKNSNLVFTGRDEDGNMRYIDISFIDPYNYWKRPINAIMRDQPWEDAAVQSIKEMVSPFLGTDILAGTVFEILANKKSTGGEIYKETDSIDRQLGNIGNHLRKAVQPGFVSNMERTWKALDGQSSSSGKKYNMWDEGLAWAGWRVSTLDPKTALYYRTFDFKDAKTDASTTLTRVLTSHNEVSDDDISDAYELVIKMRERAYSDMFKLINASKRSGMSDDEIALTLRGSRVSKIDISSLLNGEIPTWLPSKQSESGAVKKAEPLFGGDQARVIRERYRSARIYGKEIQGL